MGILDNWFCVASLLTAFLLQPSVDIFAPCSLPNHTPPVTLIPDYIPTHPRVLPQISPYVDSRPHQLEALYNLNTHKARTHASHLDQELGRQARRRRRQRRPPRRSPQSVQIQLWSLQLLPLNAFLHDDDYSATTGTKGNASPGIHLEYMAERTSEQG